MRGWATFILVVVLLVILGAAGWTIYTQYRARRLGLPAPPILPFTRSSNSSSSYRAPAPAPGGIQGWLNTQISRFKPSNTRTSAGAYDYSSGYGGGGYTSTSGRGGRGRGLDPDEAWDSHVGTEADYGFGAGAGRHGRSGSGYLEENELAETGGAGRPYNGGGYGGAGNNISVGGIEERGRSRSRQRELDERYDEEMHGGGDDEDPFGDHAASGLRGVSPRPVEGTGGGKGRGSLENERRSAFREDM